MTEIKNCHKVYQHNSDGHMSSDALEEKFTLNDSRSSIQLLELCFLNYSIIPQLFTMKLDYLLLGFRVMQWHFNLSGSLPQSPECSAGIHSRLRL